MRKLVTWTLVTLGIAALVRRLRGRRPTEISETEPTLEPTHDPAAGLRQKLDETRQQDAETSQPAAQAPSPAPEPTLDERRAEVHDQGRAAIDEMQSSSDEEDR